MINFRIIARAFSQVLIIEGLFMLVSAAVSFIYKEHTANSFLYSALITIVTGMLVFTPLRNEEKVYGSREGYIINTGIWIIFSAFGSLPYLLSGCAESFTDAFFESISGFTTTGASIFTDVESLPHGILFLEKPYPVARRTGNYNAVILCSSGNEKPEYSAFHNRIFRSDDRQDPS